MYQELQDLLAFAIEAVAIIGYGGIFAHYILTSALAKQLASPPSETIPIVSTNETVEQTKTVSTDATNETDISTTNTTICTVDTSITNTNWTTLDLLELDRIEKLTLRQCRAIIRSLNTTLPKSDRIRLKINGKDAPTSWLRSQIRKYLEDKQEQITPTIEQMQAS